MNQSILDLILNGILDREGGYVDHPADRGGPTKYGITEETLRHFAGFGEPQKIEDLTMDQARAIYQAQYVMRPGFDCITDPALLEVVVDTAVHSGPSRATRWLQEALGVTPDGVMGPVTRGALLEAHRSLDALRRVRARFLALRLRHLGRLITKAPSQAVFAAGWMARVAAFVEAL